MPLTGSTQIFSFNPQDSATVQEHNLGTLAQTTDGRAYRYTKFGELAVAGNLYGTPAIVANHNNLAVAATAIGSYSVTVTLGATAATANQYAEGYLFTVDGTGEGHTYGIKSHPAADASATLVVQLYEPIAVALVASATSEVTLYPNPYKNVVISATTATGAAAGIAPFAVASGSFGWLQTHGAASCFIEGTPAIGAALGPSNDQAGQLGLMEFALGFVGNAIQLGVGDEYRGVFLMID